MVRSPRVVRSLILILCVSLLPSCAALVRVDHTMQRHKTLVQLAVTIGVGRFLTESPQHTQLIYTVTHSARAILKDGTIDVTHIVPLVLDQLKHSVRDPEVRLLVEALVRAIAAEVQMYVADAKIPPGTVSVLISEVLGWIEQVAEMRLKPA